MLPPGLPPTDSRRWRVLRPSHRRAPLAQATLQMDSRRPTRPAMRPPSRRSDLLARTRYGRVDHHHSPPQLTTHVGCRSAWRIGTSLPAALQNSHQNGGCVFLIFVADPRIRRLCEIHASSGPRAFVSISRARYLSIVGIASHFSDAPVSGADTYSEPVGACPTRGSLPGRRVGFCGRCGIHCDWLRSRELCCVGCFRLMAGVVR
jgi:hypothetical protein